jgi:hypothetical protein
MPLSRFSSEVTDPAMVRLALEGLGLPMEAPNTVRARDPTELFAAIDVD